MDNTGKTTNFQQCLQDNLPIGLLAVSASGIILSFNPAAENITGYRADEMVGQNIKLLVPEHHRAGHDKYVQNYQARHVSGGLDGLKRELPFQHKDGSTRLANIFINEASIDDEKVYITTIQESDLSVNIKTEVIAFKNTLDIIDEAVLMFDADQMRFFYANQGARTLTGFSQMELLDRFPWDLIADYSQTDFVATFIQPLSQQHNAISLETRFTLQNGETIPVEISLYYVMPGNASRRYVAICRDISDRLRIQDRMVELARFPEETANAVFKISQNGILSYANPASEPVRKTWDTQLGDPVPPYLLKKVQACIHTQQPAQMDIETVTGQTYSLYMSPVAELDSVYAYGRDVTEERKAQRELIAHQENLEEMIEVRTNELNEARIAAETANHAKSQFLTNMSHEIRTPLGAIIGFSEYLLDVHMEEAEKVTSIHKIIKSSRHLKELIDNILDLSKIEAEKVETESLPISLNDMIEEVRSLVENEATRKGLAFKCEIPNPLPTTILSDPLRIKQILINLCNNAIKFTRQGSVTLHVDYRSQQHHCALSIIDTGIGMTPDQVGRLFQAFSQADTSTTRKYGGTGIGLALSKQLAQLLGGDITVSSTPDQGSTFRFDLPVVLPDTDSEILLSAIAAETEEDIPQLSGKVLLVEDTELLQDIACKHLNKAGLQVEIAENGQQAVDMALNGDYDLVLMDIQMPVMDGIEATQQLIKRHYSQPIIAMTANVLKEDHARCLEAGCADFIAKPVQRHHLYQTLKKHLPAAL